MEWAGRGGGHRKARVDLSCVRCLALPCSRRFRLGEASLAKRPFSKALLVSECAHLNLAARSQCDRLEAGNLAPRLIGHRGTTKPNWCRKRKRNLAPTARWSLCHSGNNHPGNKGRRAEESRA